MTTDPNDLIESDEEEGHQNTDTKQGQKDTYQNPSSLPSTIKVMKASDSHVTSSIPGLSSIMDMSMTEISEENQRLMVRGCIKNHVFSVWKFYQKDFHSHFSEDENYVWVYHEAYEHKRNPELVAWNAENSCKNTH